MAVRFPTLGECNDPHNKLECERLEFSESLVEETSEHDTSPIYLFSNKAFNAVCYISGLKQTSGVYIHHGGIPL